MTKKSIPNNPIVLLQQNLQVLRTITSQADEHTPITAFIAMQKNTLEAIKIMETHDKTGAFTIVPKAVVFLCRLVLAQNILTLKRGILEHKDKDVFVVKAKAKIVTYQNILDRLPDVPPPAAKPCETKKRGGCYPEQSKPPGLRSDVKLSTKTHFEIERKSNGPDRQNPTNRK